MRFLHVADLHIGKQVNGYQMAKEDQPFILEQILGILRERSVDALVIAGDVYDKASPSEQAVTLFDDFLTSVADLGVSCLVVPGNHDSAERLAFARRLVSRRGVHLPPVFDGQVMCVDLQDDFGPVHFWLLPFIRPVDVRRFFEDAEIGSDYTAAVRTVLEHADANPAERNVLVAHQFVTYGTAEPERADDELKLGGIDNVDASAFANFDYVALGHVHRPQRVGRDTVRYSGSPLKYSFSEARYDKSAVLVEVGQKNPGSEVGACISFELVPLRPLHDVREVVGPLDELTSFEVLAQADKNDYVRVVLTDKEPRLDALDKVRAAYPNYMEIEYQADLSRVSRETVADQVDPDDIDPMELFAQFFESVAGEPLDEEQAELVRACMEATVLRSEGGAR